MLRISASIGGFNVRGQIKTTSQSLVDSITASGVVINSKYRLSRDDAYNILRFGKQIVTIH